MGHIGIDDHQIVGRNREDIIFYLESSHTVNYIEKLRTVMGVGRTDPVTTVGCRGNI